MKIRPHGASELKREKEREGAQWLRKLDMKLGEKLAAAAMRRNSESHGSDGFRASAAWRARVEVVAHDRAGWGRRGTRAGYIRGKAAWGARQ